MNNKLNPKKETRRKRKKLAERDFKDYLYNGILKKFGAIPIELQAQVDRKIIEVTESHFNGKKDAQKG